MNYKFLSLALCFSSMHAMNNDVTPLEIVTGLSDAELVAQSLPSDTPPLHPKLLPLVATDIRNNSNPEANNITHSIVKSANDVLNNSVSKTTTAYISIATTLLGVLVSALASKYSNCSK